jgi:hypothetical protein
LSSKKADFQQLRDRARERAPEQHAREKRTDAYIIARNLNANSVGTLYEHQVR